MASLARTIASSHRRWTSVPGQSFMTSQTDHNLGGVLKCGRGIDDGLFGCVTGGVHGGTSTDDEKTGCITKGVDGGTVSWTDAGTVDDGEEGWTEGSGRIGGETIDANVAVELQLSVDLDSKNSKSSCQLIGENNLLECCSSRSRSHHWSTRYVRTWLAIHIQLNLLMLIYQSKLLRMSKGAEEKSNIIVHIHVRT